MRFASLLTILLCSCATSSSSPATSSSNSGASQRLDVMGSIPLDGGTTAKLESRSDSTMTGTARAAPAGNGVAIHLEVQNATPGEHGVHIHEKGDCSDPKATSAGGHFNPNAGAHHGGLNTPVRHGGDLGNMQVDSSGKGTLDVTVPDLPAASVAGKAIVVHEKQDDLQTDPAGNSGARVACGVFR